MISIHKGEYFYSDGIGVSNINLDIKEGESACIMGPNGAGKSTLLKILVGLYPLSAGEYLFKGIKVDAALIKDRKKIANIYKSIGLVFQNSDIQLFNNSVRDELAFGPEQMGLSDEEVKERVDEILRLLKIEHLQDRIPYHLSGGEKKLVAIDSVLTMNPDVYIFDEPFNGLSPSYRELILKLMKSLKDSGKTIIISSHHFNQLKDIADKIFVFSKEHTIDRSIMRDEWSKFPSFTEFFDNL